MTATITRDKEAAPAVTTKQATRRAKPTAEFVTITPDMALEWLKNNKTGRRLKIVHVKKIVSDLKNDRWCITGEAIKFDCHGALRDGQHRLEAIARSGVAAVALVVHELEPQAQLVMDTGTRRTVADQLRISGFSSNSGILAAGGRLALAWVTDRLAERIEHLSDSEIRYFIEDNPALIEAADFAATIRINIPQSVICAVTWRLIELGHDLEVVHEFFNSLRDLNTDGEGDPRHALLHRISTARQRRERIKLTQYLSMLVRAFNAHVSGHLMYNMNIVGRRGGNFIDVPQIVESSCA